MTKQYVNNPTEHADISGRAGTAQFRDNRALQKASPDEEELTQGKFINAPLQRDAVEEEELTQGKFHTPVQRKENKTGLPDNLKTGVETLSGLSMDGVRVHQNSSKPAQVGAHAFAQGTDIHVAPGQMKHLPHEAWHVVQQAQGRVPVTTTVDGMPVNDNPSLEKEADVMGEKANKQG
ncbi:DUF4157 domain-containing protein [Teredinibacter turnerae]|uniref:eCIS core domain-containing protein n=1 Tax=Teredinibacter turnerae TaxID=2426 RepID=UPI000426F959|nr:DUF4157 domain-containing protein [Teredinibacter turnerae]